MTNLNSTWNRLRRVWPGAVILSAGLAALLLARPASADDTDDMTIKSLQLSLTERGTIVGKVAINDFDGANPTVSIRDGRGGVMDAISADTAERALSAEEGGRLATLVAAFRGRPQFPSVFEADAAQYGDGMGRYDISVQMKVRPPQDFHFRNFAIKQGDGELDQDIAALTRALVEVGGFAKPRDDAAPNDAAPKEDPFARFHESLDKFEEKHGKGDRPEDSANDGSGK